MQTKNNTALHFSLLGLSTVDADAVTYTQQPENVLRADAIRQWAYPIIDARRKQQCQILLQESKGNIFFRH